MARSWKIIVLPLLILFLIALSFGAGCETSRLRAPEPAQQLDLIGEAWEAIFQDFLKKETLDPAALRKGAIEGMVEALGDPYTSYVDAELYKLVETHMEGAFEGIGAVITIKDEQLEVISPIKGSPAAEAGIRAGDKILEIDGESTAKMGLNEAVLKIRGKKGTKVTLTILHEGEETPVSIAVTRAEIDLESVTWEMLPQGVAHVSLLYFSERTVAELRAALKEIKARDARGIILDLRDNPGGLLPAAIGVASQFLEEGVVLYEEDSMGKRQAYSASSGGLATKGPLAVLVNENSASASEIVAGALQDRNRASLIGTKTFGKGVIQRVTELSDGSALFISAAFWLTPAQHQIEGQGLVPDFTVEITEEDRERDADPQLERALEYVLGL